MRNQFGLGTDDPEATEAVAERNRNKLRYTRIVTQTECLVQWDVARRRVDVKDARKNQLERTSLGSYDEINALRVAREAAFQLAAGDQQQRDRADAEYQQQKIERSGKTALSDIRN